jgi:hypothetical protein
MSQHFGISDLPGGEDTLRERGVPDVTPALPRPNFAPAGKGVCRSRAAENGTGSMVPLRGIPVGSAPASVSASENLENSTANVCVRSKAYIRRRPVFPRSADFSLAGRYLAAAVRSSLTMFAAIEVRGDGEHLFHQASSAGACERCCCGFPRSPQGALGAGPSAG